MRLFLSRLKQSLFALGLLAVALALRLPFYSQTIWNLDEGSTFTMAQIIRHGGVLYRDAADNRTPLVPYAKALLLTFVGDWNVRGVHIAVALMIGLTAVLLWGIARRLGDARAGAAGAVFFTLLSFVMLATADPMATHTGWFLIFFSAVGFWIFASALSAERTWPALIAGLAFGLAAMAKQPGLLDLIVALVLCALLAVSAPARRTRCLRLAGLLLAGFGAVVAGTAAYFYLNGAWHDFIYYTWIYNTTLYVPELPFWYRLAMVRVSFDLAYHNAFFALCLGCLAAVWLLARVFRTWCRREPLPVFEWLVLGWAASGLASTMLSGRSFSHYSIQVLPGLSLSCGWACLRLLELATAWWKTRRFWPAFALGLLLATGFADLGSTLVRQLRGYKADDGPVREWGEFIEANTNPRDRIFVWGYMPELHVYSRRLPNTRFVYSVFLTGLIPWTNLEPLKNTDYAIVPGAWDAFWSDFQRRRPVFIVDTGHARGFLKYPLQGQKKLWAVVESEYVEVTPLALPYADVRLFKRATVPAPSASDVSLPVDSQITLESKPRHTGQTGRVSVTVPEGVQAMTVWVDGHPYHKVELPAQNAVRCSFPLPSAEISGDEHIVFVVAQTGSGSRKSPDLTLPAATPPTNIAAGPALIFEGESIFPVESETGGDEPKWNADRQWWTANTPARLVYVRPPDMEWLDFSFGLSPLSYDLNRSPKTDGVEVLVIFEEQTGKQTVLYRRYLDPVVVGADQGTQTGAAKLPDNTPGRIILMITPGHHNDPTCDWAYWKSVSGEHDPIRLIYRGTRFRMESHQSTSAGNWMDFHTKRVALVRAPSQFFFRLQPGMHYLTGNFGLPDEAWNKEQKTQGTVFTVTHVADDGVRTVLYRRTLEPATNATDHGLQSFNTKVPSSGQLEFATAAAHDDNSSCDAFWDDLVVGDLPATISYHDQEIVAVNATATFGFISIKEQGSDVLFAHPSSEIVYAVPPGATRLDGAIGLLSSAYSGANKSDGATFIVEFETEAGVRKEIFRRALNPRDVPDDRGKISISVDLPSNRRGRVVLRTEPRASGLTAFAWSYWSELRFAP
jgi:Dolichyl-phosphate-mannose-protein mannosyltransferase